MDRKKDLQVQFQPVGKRIEVPSGTTLFEAARQAGIDLTTACGGEGNCGQCQVVLLAGEVTPLTADEQFLIDAADRENGYRLACCTRVLGDVKVHLPKDSLVTGQRLQVESNLQAIPPDPFVRAFPLELTPPSLQDVRSDLSRLTDGLEAQHGLKDLHANTDVIRNLSPDLRRYEWRANVFVADREIVAVRPPGQSPLGLAVDLGTTKIAAFLVDLQTGQDLAAGGAPNPQISYGEDVISRLNYAHRNPDGGRLLAGKVRQTLDELLGDLLLQVGAERGQVAEACIVGNTAMTHLLLEFPVHQLAVAPFVSAASAALDVRASELGLRMAPGATVHIPPTIGGFVGADHVAMVLASDLDQSDKVTLGLDIGTNTEISLRLPGVPHLTAVSCASGPAFEGAHIRDGMRAASGAIEKVRLNAHAVELTTIDEEPAVGLCGSGILDTIAELYRTGRLDRSGRFQRDRQDVRSGTQGPEFVLVPSQISGSGRDIVITQKDVNEIQLAKGAIQAGLNILLEATAIPAEAVQEVIVAGAFGSYLNIQNAINMGLFPHLPNAQYRQVGNAAALGAKWILISRLARRRARQIARQTRYLELTTYPRFSRQFALAMLFPGQNR
ncbi:MAG: ASKHA domain-containing protein [Anaerolineales bacterium]|jgi:uncharacterized 2Fe-2S/4Fe-4S cluster protein (DUF4445 family)